MLLATLTINGTTRRISDQELSLEHSWYGELSQPPTIKYATAKEYGGMVAPTFGGFTCLPTTFIDSGALPPTSMTLLLQYTESTEAAAITLLESTCHLAGFDRSGIAYEARKKERDQLIAPATLSGTLVALFTTHCGSTKLNLTLDATKARTPSPAVSYVLTSESQTLAVLSDMAAFFGHLFYIEGTTLHLVDMLVDNGAMTMTEFDVHPIPYSGCTPYATIKAGNTAVDGSYAYGAELSVAPVCHGTGANITAALTTIKTLVDRPRVTLSMPITAQSAVIKPGMRLSWADTALYRDAAAWLMARSIQYDFGQQTITIEGEGGIT